jgi:hypothetical protein
VVIPLPLEANDDEADGVLNELLLFGIAGVMGIPLTAFWCGWFVFEVAAPDVVKIPWPFCSADSDIATLLPRAVCNRLDVLRPVVEDDEEAAATIDDTTGVKGTVGVLGVGGRMDDCCTIDDEDEDEDDEEAKICLLLSIPLSETVTEDPLAVMSKDDTLRGGAGPILSAAPACISTGAVRNGTPSSFDMINDNDGCSHAYSIPKHQLLRWLHHERRSTNDWKSSTNE